MEVYLALLALACLGAHALVAARRKRRLRGLGLQPEGSVPTRVLAADDSSLGSSILRSERLRLTGRPDALVRVAGQLIPVEYKPTAGRLYRSHELQPAALCALLKGEYGERPPYGVVVLAGGRQVRVPYTAELESALLAELYAVRKVLQEGQAPGPEWKGRRCEACGYRAICWGGSSSAPLPPGRCSR